MELNEALELSVAILGTLGSGAAIILGFSSWLGKVWANRLMAKEKAVYTQELESLRSRLTQDTESYKIKLKKSEFLFQKEFEAASELIALIRSFLPIYQHPEMDWYDVCNEIALDFTKIEVKLDGYLSKHGAVLKEEVVNLISSCAGIAGKYKFDEIPEPNIVPPEASDEANTAANHLYNKLKEAEKIALQQVHSQSST
jgi:hypothetical protein